MIKAIYEMNEGELREAIATKRNQYTKAQARFDKFGSFDCQSQANKYLKKYADLLYVAFNRGYELTKEEKETVSLIKVRIV